MNTLKYILFIIGFILITYSKSSYIKRKNSSNTIFDKSYNKKEKIYLYTGYFCFIISVLLAGFNI